MMCVFYFVLLALCCEDKETCSSLERGYFKCTERRFDYIFRSTTSSYMTMRTLMLLAVLVTAKTVEIQAMPVSERSTLASHPNTHQWDEYTTPNFSNMEIKVLSKGSTDVEGLARRQPLSTTEGITESIAGLNSTLAGDKSSQDGLCNTNFCKSTTIIAPISTPDTDLNDITVEHPRSETPSNRTLEPISTVATPTRTAPNGPETIAAVRAFMEKTGLVPLATVGVVLNVLSLWVWQDDRTYNATTFLFKYLACWDIICLLTLVLFVLKLDALLTQVREINA